MSRLYVNVTKLFVCCLWIFLCSSLLPSAAKGEGTAAKIARLSKLSGQAFFRKNVSRGESYLVQAYETAEGYLSGRPIEAFGEYPHVARAFFKLLTKRIEIHAARRDHRQAVEIGTSGLTTLEEIIGQLNDENLVPIKDVIAGYFAILEKIVLAEMSRGGEEDAVALMERGMDVYEGLMGQLRNRLARGMVVKQYCQLVGKLAKYYLGLGRTEYARQVISRARNKLSDNLGADHPTTRAMEGHLEKLSKG